MVNDVSGSTKRRIGAAFAAVLLSCALAACSEKPEDPVAPADDKTSTQASKPEKTEEEPPRSPESTGETETSKSDPSETSKPDDELGEGVAEAQEIFAPLLPAALWSEFESCSATGIQDSYECSSREVGQFQLFESRSKAASTTQLLTELRSSRVVRDTGRFVIGWSTLGTTAVITIVDNDEGLVAQQLVSSDQVEPDERIAELGLDEPAGLGSTGEAEESTEPTKEEKSRDSVKN